MANRVRGESTITIDGKDYKACANLNALAEIEDALGLDSIDELGPRLEKPKARDIIAVVGALIRGGGAEIDNDEVGKFDMAAFDQITDVINGGMPESDAEDEDTPVNPPETGSRKKRKTSGKK